ncbi:hypothetical protein PENTCL1PPCAC_4048, partial [Pristionchus entomophagus]
MNETTSGPKTIDDRIAAGLIFGVGLTGVLLNLTGVLLTFRVRALRTSFGRLTAVHCSADCVILAIFAFWCAPRTLFESQDHDALLSRKIGQVSLYFWFVTLYSQLAIALNRFSLLFFPRVYKEVFQRRTCWLIIFNSLVCTCHFCVYFGDGCDFFYNAETFYWQFADTPCGTAVSFWLDFIFGCVICIIVLLLDIICVANMRKSAAVLGEAVTARERKLRWGREKRFLAQACCTGLLFTVMLISFHIVSRYVSGLWPTFISTSLIWELSHLGDGIILFTFNRELQRALKNPKILFSFSTIKDSMQAT